MKCPHCLVEFHAQPIFTPLANDIEGYWYITHYHCPNPKCLKLIGLLCEGSLLTSQGRYWEERPPSIANLIRPRGINRAPIPIEVNEIIAGDYIEACLVLNDSPKASAALSRRCLQNVLLEKAGVKKGDLSNQIQTVIDSGKLPSHIEDEIDAVRNIGNFAAHPSKSNATGEILEVEPHEAEWNLQVLESLFDFYYVQPERAKARKAALNAKLSDSGKPPMK